MEVQKEINGNQYIIQAPTVLMQSQILRKLTAILQGIDTSGNMSPMALGVSFVSNLHLLPDADFNFVQTECLRCVKRLDSGLKAPVLSNGKIMYDDIDLLTLILLTKDVLSGFLTPFFGSLQKLSQSE